jgi:hypothetical protein
VLVANRQAWLSGVNRPDIFAGSPDLGEDPDADPDDTERPVTEYISDNKAEDGMGIVGQDSLYLATRYSCYAKVGDKPGESTVCRRLPGSRGAVGRRSFYALGGGILVGSDDMLAFYSVGRGFQGEDNGTLTEREETAACRESYRSLLGDSYSGLVVAEYLDQIWLFNGAKYMVNTRTRRWHEGTFADSVKAVWADRARGFVFADAKGRLMKISADYVDDNGVEASWSYQTGLFDGPRLKMQGILIQSKGTPTVEVSTYDGQGGRDSFEQTLDEGEVWLNPGTNPGFRIQMRFSGVVGRDRIESCIVEYASTGQARAN